MASIVLTDSAGEHHRDDNASVDALRVAYRDMCKAVPGGWAAMAAALGMSKTGLENRVYERKGQSVDVHLAMQMQATSGSEHFAQAVAAESGGVFIALPSIDVVDHEEIQAVYMDLVDEVGRLAHEWRTATADGEVCARERKRLEGLRLAICEKVTRMNHLTFAVFCKQ